MNLLNKQNTRAYILKRVKVDRPGWDCTRVSPAAMKEIERRLKVMIGKVIHMHPTRGKTFREIF